MGGIPGLDRAGRRHQTPLAPASAPARSAGIAMNLSTRLISESNQLTRPVGFAYRSPPPPKFLGPWLPERERPPRSGCEPAAKPSAGSSRTPRALPPMNAAVDAYRRTGASATNRGSMIRIPPAIRAGPAWNSAPSLRAAIRTLRSTAFRRRHRTDRESSPCGAGLHSPYRDGLL
jgi:hypothetical protein